ncbi:ImmA/IrrE family metallo-endopeptidase [Brucella pseudintermedia]|uniref:ImmA/IrrE family metallo-endopeptidase n=1 Tax=Brucella pseudintermedia TaxID=370111 RepID=UPI0036728481|nr:ImmA/IrrE family metallo-endopeptidase [Brucella pseudintermedia]
MSMIPAEHAAMIAKHSAAPPVDVAAIANELGLAIFSADLAHNVSGVIVKDASYGTSSGFAIFVDSGESPQRQRFTAAHEIGHFLLHRHLIGDRHEDNYLLRSVGISNRQEQQANQFAADLLMPRNLIEKAMQEGYTSVESLADLFQVSRIAMGIRLGLPT